MTHAELLKIAQAGGKSSGCLKAVKRLGIHWEPTTASMGRFLRRMIVFRCAWCNQIIEVCADQSRSNGPRALRRKPQN